MAELTETVTSLNVTLEQQESEIRRLQDHLTEIDANDAEQDKVSAENADSIKKHDGRLGSLEDDLSTFEINNPITDELGDPVKYTKYEDFQKEYNQLDINVRGKMEQSSFERFLEKEYWPFKEIVIHDLPEKIEKLDAKLEGNLKNINASITGLNSAIRSIESDIEYLEAQMSK